MTQDTESYNLAKIRDLLRAAFSVQELRRFCFYRPQFRPVIDEFSEGDGLADMVDIVVEYCERQRLLRTLLQEVGSANPSQYARFAAYHLLSPAPADSGASELNPVQGLEKSDRQRSWVPWAAGALILFVVGWPIGSYLGQYSAIGPVFGWSCIGASWLVALVLAYRAFRLR
jgi:hypothetical protein